MTLHSIDARRASRRLLRMAFPRRHAWRTPSCHGARRVEKIGRPPGDDAVVSGLKAAPKRKLRPLPAGPKPNARGRVEGDELGGLSP